MSLAEAYRAHAYAVKRYRKEFVKGNESKAKEHWEEASKLWRAIGLATLAELQS